MSRLSGITGFGCLQFPLKWGQPTVGALSRVVFYAVMFCCALDLLLCSAASFAATVQLPRTGQTTCYNTAGSVIPCTGTGQDGDWLAGVVWPSPRFAVGTGPEIDCVTDNLTGLMWVKSPDSTERTWTEAIDHASGLDLCGYTDWRLPNINELRSLVHSGYNEEICGGSPCNLMSDWLNSKGFSNVQLFNYWSSTTNAYNTYSAYVIDMVYGLARSHQKTLSAADLPVRGPSSGAIQIPATGQSVSYYLGDDGNLGRGTTLPSPRFHDNSNGTVTDNLTGLIWLKNANCTDTAGVVTKGSGYLTWADALMWSNSLGSGACGLSDGSKAGDWRLPNSEELKSLIDFGYYSPSISNTAGTGHWTQGDAFTNVPSSSFQRSDYWSSTTSMVCTSEARSVFMLDSDWSYESKTDSKYVWPVRGTCNVPFTDVPSGYWAENYIKEMYCRGITTGCGTRLYCPSNNVTRFAMAAFIIRALGETTSVAAYNAYFDDIANNNFAPYINRMYELGITTGCGTRLYCPSNNVTRLAMAAFIIRAFY